MKAALSEQGFTNKHVKANSLMEWQNSEFTVMENILNNHSLDRDVKNAKHKHQSVPEYKASRDWKKFPKRKKNLTTLECYENDLRETRQENSLLKAENDKLTTERNSSWKCFYFNDPDKQLFVINELERLNIPCRESNTGFEAQQCHVEKIRSIEKQYKAEPINHRDRLRDKLDRIIMQVNSYDKIFDGLKHYGYEIKHGKYTSVKPPDSDRFIRIKSLGEYYNENALRNRINNKLLFESDIDNRMNEIKDKYSLSYFNEATVKQYVLTFRKGTLPARKIRKDRPFTWINDVELDRLASLNKKIKSIFT